MRQLGSTELKRLHREWRRRTDGEVSIILDSIAGPFNLGAIIRSAAAYRIDHIWVAASQIDPTNTKVSRTALGTDRYVEWTATETTAEAIALARARGHRIVGLELAEGAEPIHHADLSAPICLVVGHEDRGLSKPTLEALDAAVYLPQLGKVGSLNIATATAIALWEIRRQTWGEN